MKARLKSYGVQFKTLGDCHEAYEKFKDASRTHHNGVKVVNLAKMGLYNTSLRPDGKGGFLFRLYDTDIVHYSADGYIHLKLDGYPTNTTFCRISQACGVSLFHMASSNAITTCPTRMYTEEMREGVTSGYIRSSIPFTDGMRVHAVTHEVHPEDVACIPEEKRREYQTPSKETAAAFKPLWAKIVGIIKLNVSLGAWTQDVLAMPDVRGWSGRIYLPRVVHSGVQNALSDMFLKLHGDEPLTSNDVRDFFFVSLGGKDLGNEKDIEEITRRLKAAIPNVRKKLLLAYADQSGEFVTKGGHLLGRGYYEEKPK